MTLTEKNISELGSWCKCEMNNKNRTKASKIYKVLLKFSKIRYPSWSENEIKRYFGL